MSTIATVSDLETYLKLALDAGQAQLILDMVEADAAAVVSPLPASAKGVIITAAARAIPNPSGTSSESLNGSSASWGGGIYLTRSERRTLARLAGNGKGAFSVNVAPNAGKCYRDALRVPTLDDQERFSEDFDLP